MDLSLQIPFFSFPERMLSLEEKRNLNLNFSFSRIFFLFLPSFYHSKHFTTIPLSGETKKPLTLMEGRLGLTRRRPNCPPTGTHPSPRSASVWRLANRSGLLSSTSRRIPCTLWSLMGNTAKPHWVVKRGSHWLVLMPPCSTTVTRKDLITPGVNGWIISNHGPNCRACRSRIGFGTGGRIDKSNTCGNDAGIGADNGFKLIKAMGYVLVQ